jgi:phosphate transport system permease protein
MATARLAPEPSGPAVVRPPRETTASWPLIDRLGCWLCWATGIGLCLIAAAIVLYMFVKGISELHLSLFLESPAPSLHQNRSGGFLDPIVGTLIITAVGILIAAPAGVALATWLSEYRRPLWLARAVESAIETIGGVPSIVLAIFGLLIFSRGFFVFLSQGAAVGATGQSFLTAGIVMAVLALPLIVGATREALAQLPGRLREGSYALGKTQATTIRRVLLPSIRPGMASGIVLGMGRIIGDTAIVIFVLGSSTYRNEGVGGIPLLSTLRGTGATLTSYVYNNSPAGEGNSPQKAYAAAFVLLMIVLALNALVTRLTNPRDRPRARSLATRLGARMPWIG